MSRLYACIVSDSDKEKLVSIARQFAYGVELLDDAVLFDISGTRNIFGAPEEIAQKIYEQLLSRKITANVAIASNAAAALLHARNQKGISVIKDDEHAGLPLSSLDIEADTLEILHALGLKNISELNRIDECELIARYGPEFRDTVDIAKNRGNYVITPNLKENRITWHSALDFKVDDFQQLIFLVSNGLEKILAKTSYCGFSTERIDITLGLGNRSSKSYRIKLSFPTLDKKFWLIIINLRIANDPPEAEINSIDLAVHFTRPRSVQRGLFASTKPEPENLQLTVDKIKNFAGAENVGVPVLLDRRLPKAFALNPDKLPAGSERLTSSELKPVLALNYFDPPLTAQVIIDKKSLLYLRTPLFEGRVAEYGGAWKSSSQWWSLRKWRSLEWDVELEDQGLYRLQQNGRNWLVIGKYD
jgi:hypothetical protein